MARRPASATALYLPYERVWAAVQKVGARGATFTVWSVQDACEPMVRSKTVASYIARLRAAGFVGDAVPTKVLRQHGNRHATPELVLLKDSFEAPRVLPDGTPARKKGMAQLAMWRAMRALKTFSARDLATSASVDDFRVSETTARIYIQRLRDAGYLAEVRAGKARVLGEYRLVKFTGPHAPAITDTRAVLDRNTGELLHLQSPQEVCDGLE